MSGNRIDRDYVWSILPEFLYGFSYGTAVRADPSEVCSDLAFPECDSGYRGWIPEGNGFFHPSDTVDVVWYYRNPGRLADLRIPAYALIGNGIDCLPAELVLYFNHGDHSLVPGI